MTKRADLSLALAIALVGAAAGIVVVFQRPTVFFYQTFTPELVYSACGYGLRHPGLASPQLLEFLSLKKLTFDCSQLLPVENLGPPGLFVRLQLYSSLIVAAIWRISSLSYLNLWPFVGLIVGSYSAGCYVLFRQFFDRVPSALGAIFLTLSSLGLPLVLSLRDYGKAPFFIWAVAFLILALRATNFRNIVLNAAASGLLVGIGSGFRADLVILLPIGIVTLPIVFDPRLFAKRAIAAGVFAAMTLIAAYPILSAGNGGTHGSVIIQGMSDPFRSYLKLAPSIYSFGAKYSDELVLSSVAADEAPRVANWDADEGKPVYGVSQALTLSGQNWERFFPLFLADFVTQATKSASWIVGFPAIAAPDKPRDPGYPVMHGPPASIVMKPLYMLLAAPWMPWLGLAGLMLFFWRIWSASKFEAVSIALLFGALATYSVVQFSIRHVFHLEFIWVVAMLSLLKWPFFTGAMRSGAVSYFATLTGAVALGFSGYLFLVRHQQVLLTSRFEELLAHERELAAEASGSTADTPLHIPLSVPAAYEELIHSPPDSMTPKISGIGIQWEVRSAADRILVTFAGKSCTDKIELTANYAKTPDVWQPMDDSVKMLANQPADGAIILIPAFYRPTQYLSSLDVKGVSAGCKVKLERIKGTTAFPMLMRAVIPPNWKELKLHLGFGGF